MTLQNLHEILEETGLSVWKYQAFQETMPYIVYAPVSITFNLASGTIWRRLTSVGVDVYSQKDEDAETLEKVLLKNYLIPTSIIPLWIPDHKVINTQFDLSISQEIDAYAETGDIYG